MTRSLLTDAFEHHVWATMRVLDACAALSPEQLGTTVPGTYGSIIDTLRHLVGGDAGYLFVLTDGRVAQIDEADEARPASGARGPRRGGRANRRGPVGIGSREWTTLPGERQTSRG